jgi:nucleoside-diphosphate-sugar epimerase
MRILLTGSDGFTGLFFKKAAEAAGHVVHALQADLREPQQLTTEVQSAAPEAVVHLAAISFVGHDNAADFYNVNVVGTVNLLNALTALPVPPQKVLLASSANIYGNTDTSPIDETQTPAPVNHYAASKVAMELMAANYVAQLPLVVARPFNYTGPGQADNFLIPKLVKHFKTKAPFIERGNLNVEREFNDVRMVCDAYLALLKLQPSSKQLDVFNICSGTPYTLQQVLDALTALTGHHIDVKVNPAFVRANEVQKLCGNPQRLQKAVGTLPTYTLKDTLQSMLQSNPELAP